MKVRDIMRGITLDPIAMVLAVTPAFSQGGFLDVANAGLAFKAVAVARL
jgi:hypothetical protein